MYDKGQAHWNLHTIYKEEMFSKTHTSYTLWVIVKPINKNLARLETIRHVLDTLPYAGKEIANGTLHPDLNVIFSFTDEAPPSIK